MTTTDEVEIILVEDNPDDAALAIRALKKNNLANNLIHLNNSILLSLEYKNSYFRQS